MKNTFISGKPSSFSCTCKRLVFQGCLVLLSFHAGTRNGGIVGFTVRSSRVHAYKNHEPYWAEMEMGQETNAPDGNRELVAGFIVRHPKAGTNFSLLRLASDSRRFEFLANQFRECWKKGKAPDVGRIYEIQVTALALAVLVGVRVLARWRLLIRERAHFGLSPWDCVRRGSTISFPCGS